MFNEIDLSGTVPRNTVSFPFWCQSTSRADGVSPHADLADNPQGPGPLAWEFPQVITATAQPLTLVIDRVLQCPASIGVSSCCSSALALPQQEALQGV